MLYIEGDVANNWSSTVRVLWEAGPLDMVLQHYPSTDPVLFPMPFCPSGSSEELEAVTGWGDGDRSIMSGRASVDDQLLAQVSVLPTENYVADWDFAAYEPGSTHWVACAVPHENMVMVGDDALLERLRMAGLDASTEPPSWW